MVHPKTVICGAGIAGISSAYALAVEHGWTDITLIDERPPLSLTSDRSTEAYRNWWPSESMTALMNRSIDRMEFLADSSGNSFHLNRRGYLYCTAREAGVQELEHSAVETARLGGTPLRRHTRSSNEQIYIASPVEGFRTQDNARLPDGADLLLDPELIQRNFSYLNPNLLAGLHVRRAGWFSAQQLGMLMLERARQAGVQFISGQMVDVHQSGGCITGVALADCTRLPADRLIIAAGPLLKDVARWLGLELPIFNELHLKVAFKLPATVLDRGAPLIILTDPQNVDWDEDERLELGSDPELKPLLDKLAAGLHARPEGGPGSEIVLGLWEYHLERLEPVWPIPIDPMYAEVVLRGLESLLPGLRRMRGRLSRPVVDGGYYTKTAENLPLIGPLPVDGAYVIGALSGYGMMAACGAGELLAAHVVQAPVPAFAAEFLPSRVLDPAYTMTEIAATGQL